MGGYGSGRQEGRPTADRSLRIDLAWMLRTGRAREGLQYRGTLLWTCGSQPSGSINYVAAMHQQGQERLELTYTNSRRDEREQIRQTVHLTYTLPHYGGKRWWMICPVNGERAGKLYLPPGGDIFASRKAWRLAYQSQRDAARDRPFERLFRLQRKLGCTEGWEQPIFKPKGMWDRTWQRHRAEYWRLDALCTAEMMVMMGMLRQCEIHE